MTMGVVEVAAPDIESEAREFSAIKLVLVTEERILRDTARFTPSERFIRAFVRAKGALRRHALGFLTRKGALCDRSAAPLKILKDLPAINLIG